MAPRKPKPDKPPLSKIPEMTSSWAGNYTYFPTPLSEAEYIQAWNEWVEAARAKGPLTREVWDSFQAKHGELYTADGAKFKPGKVNPTKVRAKPGDPKLKKVRGGRLSATAGEGINMRNWRGQLAAYITQGTPLSTDSAKHKSDLGDMLEAHHRIGNAEHAPWLDDIIEMLRSSDPKIKAQGVSMVEAGRAYFDAHPVKRPVGNVKQNYDFHPRIRHQGLKGKQPHLSVHGVSGTGDPSIPMGDDPFINKATGLAEVGDPGHRVTGPGGKSQWVHPTTGEPLELAQDIRKLPWTKQETMSWVEQGIYKGKGQKFPRKGGPIPDENVMSRWSTWKDFIEESNPIREQIKADLEADPTMRTDAEIAAGRRGLSKIDRELLGTDAPRSVGAAGWGQLAPSTGEGVDLTTIRNRSLDALSSATPRVTRGLRQGQGLVTMGLGYELRDPTMIGVGAFQTGIQTRPVQKQIAKQTIRAVNTKVGQAIARRTAAQLGKTGTKAIPVVGDLAIGLPELWNYTSRGKFKQAGVSAVSTVIGMVPLKGDLISATLDGWNMYEDIKEIRRQLGEQEGDETAETTEEGSEMSF